KSSGGEAVQEGFAVASLKPWQQSARRTIAIRWIARLELLAGLSVSPLASSRRSVYHRVAVPDIEETLLLEVHHAIAVSANEAVAKLGQPISIPPAPVGDR